MEIQKTYPEEFTGMYDKKYKLIKQYKNYGLYMNIECGYKICFDLNGIKREQTLKRK